MTGHASPAAHGEIVKRRRAWLWPGIVIGMLSVHAAGCLIVALIATSDPSQAVVPDYHAKAVAWDEHRAQQRASAALGWACTIETAMRADMLGQRGVRVSLRDADGGPLTGAAVTVTAYHHARANQVTDMKLDEATPGEYAAMMSMRRAGLWTFNVQAKHGGDDFTAEVNQQVGPDSWTAKNTGGTQ